jgi:hypothetical protein
MPQFTQLGYNTHVALEALDPTTGDPIDGVTVSAVEIWADVGEDTSAGGRNAAGPYMLVPGPNA